MGARSFRWTKYLPKQVLGLLTLAAVALPVFLAEALAAPSPMNVYVNSTTGSSANCAASTPAAPCDSITDALNVVAQNGTIHVAAGTYTEAIDVTQSVKIIGAGKGSTTIAAPSTMPSDGSIVTVEGASTSASLSDLTVSGPFDATSCAPSEYGVKIDDSAAARLKDMSVTNVQDADSSLYGCQHGIGILVGHASESTTGTATINGVTVSGYQKGGIVVDNTGSSATIENSTVSGAGPVGYTAQNGIQVSRGATATIKNDNVTGNSYTDTASNGATAAGILLYGAGDHTIVKNDTITGNQIGYYTEDQANLKYLSLSGITGNTRNAVAWTTGDYGPAWPTPTVAYADAGLTGTSDNVYGSDIVATEGSLHVWGYDAFNTIQGAVNAAASGGTVRVAAGAYNENVTVKNPLTIDGANSGTAGYASRGNESAVSGSFNVQASNVTINGFTIDPASGSSVAMQGNYSGENVENNIIDDNGYAVNFNTGNTSISSNQINYGAHPTTGIEANSNPGNVIHFFNNHFSGNGSALPADITVIGGSPTRTEDVFVDKNTSTSGATLIALFNTRDATISHNISTGAQGSAIYIGGGDSYIGVNDDNVISRALTAVNIANDYGDGPNDNVAINDNQFDATNATGIKVEANANAYTANAPVNATGNWWGSASGPYDNDAADGSVPADNPDGSGSPAVGAVKYGPWCTVADCSTTAPTTPTDGQPSGGIYKNTNVFNYTWTASSGNGPITYEYQASQNPAESGGILTTGLWDNITNHVNNSQYPLTQPLIPSVGTSDGTWYWQVRAIDANGQKSPWSQIWHYTLDTHPPTGLANLSPANPTITTTADLQKITWSTASDPNGPITYSYESSHSSATNANGSFTNPVYGPVSTGSTTYINTPNTPAGVYYWNVKACDAAGNCTNWTTPWKIIVDNTVLAAPNLASPSNGAVVNGASLTNSWSSVPNAVKYEYESFNSNNPNGLVRFDGTYAATSKTATNVADGTVFYWRVRAVDQYGQAGPWSNGGALWKVTVDNTAPVVAITAPTSTDLRGTVTISGTVTDANPDHYYLVVKDANGNVVAGPGTVYAANVADYGWDTTTVADGAYTIDLEARDAAGNKGPASTATLQVIVDNTAPATPTATPAAGSYTSAQLVSLSSSDSGSGLAGIYYTTDGSTPSSTNGTFIANGGSFEVSSSETVEAIAYDNAGNASPVMTASYTIKPNVVANFVTFGSGGGTPTFSPQHTVFASTVNTGNAGNASGNAGNTGGGQVKGANTTTPNTGSNNGSNGQVKGDSTVKLTSPANKKVGSFLGLGWWWLLVLAIILGLFYATQRRSDSTTA